MKSITTLVVGCLFIFFGCKEKEEDKLHILGNFLFYDNTEITIYINDSLIFNDKMFNQGVIDKDLLLVTINKINSPVKFHISLNDLDTIFNYNLKGVDSLLIINYQGRHGFNDKFQIWNQEEIKKYSIED